MSIRILLADNHAIIREGLCSLFEKHDDAEVVGCVEDGRSAVDLVRELLPNVVIMDVMMPILNGIEATRLITGEFPDVKVIALSIHSHRRYVAEMLAAGATGYILKECFFDELMQAVRTVVRGGRHLSPGLAETVVEDHVEHLSTTIDTPLAGLTDREREALQLIAEGKPTKEIALQLNVSLKTVEADRRKIMRKLNAHSIAELTKFALCEGLTAL